MQLLRSDMLNPLARLSAMAVLFVSVAVFSNAGAAETDVSKEVKEAGAAIADYTVEQKDAAMKKAREMMDALDDRMYTLEVDMEKNWENMKEESRKKYRASLKAMREKRNDLSQWYGSMKHSSKDAWQEVKTGFAESYHSLVNAMKEAKEEMTTE